MGEIVLGRNKKDFLSRERLRYFIEKTEVHSSSDLSPSSSDFSSSSSGFFEVEASFLPSFAFLALASSMARFLASFCFLRFAAF